MTKSGQAGKGRRTGKGPWFKDGIRFQCTACGNCCRNHGDGFDYVYSTMREDLYVIQTPQAFSAEVLREALSGSEEAGDCSALVEAKGYRVRVVEGDPHLLKITSPADLELVQTWL